MQQIFKNKRRKSCWVVDRCHKIWYNVNNCKGWDFPSVCVIYQITKENSPLFIGDIMKYENYLFDLDGTLTDPGLGIKNSIRYALEKYGLPELDTDTLEQFIGPPLLESFQKYCHVTAEESEKLLLLYREYFVEHGLYENRVYPEIPEILEELTAKGAKLYVATSKPEAFAVKILEYFGLLEYFTFVGGSTMDEQRTAKQEVIEYVLETRELDPAKTVMIGDRCYDINGGKACGLKTVGVLFGYGCREELEGADYLIGAPLERLDLE